MKIKKGYFVLGMLLMALVLASGIGFNLWNSQIIGNLAKISQFSLYLILIFAFFAGAISFFSPCGLALMPAFISYNMAMVDGKASLQKSKVRILKIGLFSALGIATFYVILGVLFSVMGVVIAPYVKLFQFLIAFLFFIFGIMLLRNIGIAANFFDNLRENVHSHAIKQSGYKGFYLFGFAYGLDIIGCLFPLISALILIPIATGDLISGIAAFISYSIALAIMLSVFAYLIAFSKKTLVSDVLKSTQNIKKWLGWGFIVGGIALLSYYTVYGMGVG